MSDTSMNKGTGILKECAEQYSYYTEFFNKCIEVYEAGASKKEYETIGDFIDILNKMCKPDKDIDNNINKRKFYSNTIDVILAYKRRLRY